MAATNYLWSKTALILSPEGSSTPGSLADLGSDDHNIRFFEIGIDPDIESWVNEYASGRHSKGVATMGKQKVTFTAKAALLLGTAAGTAPKLGKALKICGSLEAAGTKVLTASIALSTSNSTTVTVNSTTTSATVYSGSHAATMAAIAAKVAAITGVASCVVSGDSLIIVPASGTTLTTTTGSTTSGATVTWASASATSYTPHADEDQATATIRAFFVPPSGTGAIMVTGKGCMGTCSLAMDSVVHPFVASFTFTGALYSIDDYSDAIPALESVDTAYAPTIIGTTSYLTDGGNAYDLPISKCTLDFGNSIELEVDASDNSGYGASYVAKRDPKLSLDPKAKLQSDDPSYTRWKNGTEALISIPTASANGLKWTLAANRAQLITNKLGKRGEEPTYEQSFELHEAHGNDQWVLVQA